MSLEIKNALNLCHKCLGIQILGYPYLIKFLSKTFQIFICLTNIFSNGKKKMAIFECMFPNRICLSCNFFLGFSCWSLYLGENATFTLFYIWNSLKNYYKKIMLGQQKSFPTPLSFDLFEIEIFSSKFIMSISWSNMGGFYCKCIPWGAQTHIITHTKEEAAEPFVVQRNVFFF